MDCFKKTDKMHNTELLNKAAQVQLLLQLCNWIFIDHGRKDIRDFTVPAFYKKIAWGLQQQTAINCFWSHGNTFQKKPFKSVLVYKCNKFCKFTLFFSWNKTYTVYAHMHRQYKPLCAIELCEICFIIIFCIIGLHTYYFM